MPEARRGRAAASRQLIAARTPWARVLAYSRAVRVGRQIYMSGTLPVDAEGHLVGGDSAHLQACQVLGLILAALSEAGASAADVVRMRIYLRDYADLPAIAAAQLAVFESVRPACTVVQTTFAHAGCLVQMEADAILSRGSRPGRPSGGRPGPGGRLRKVLTRVARSPTRA